MQQNNFNPKQNSQKGDQPQNSRFFVPENINEEQNRRVYGLQKVDDFKNLNKDMGMLILGVDLTNFGLNFNDNNTKLYETFAYPFADNPSRKTDPMNFKLPSCYSKPQTFINKQFFNKFPEETLFYIFYNIAEESTQMMAVEELYAKGWKYLASYKTWFSDLQETSKNNFKCKYFNIQKWGTSTMNNLQLQQDEEFCKLEDFQSEQALNNKQ